MIEEYLPTNEKPDEPVRLFQFGYENGGGNVLQLPDGRVEVWTISMNVETEDVPSTSRSTFESFEAWWNEFTATSEDWIQVRPLFIHEDVKPFLLTRILESDTMEYPRRRTWLRKLGDKFSRSILDRYD